MGLLDTPGYSRSAADARYAYKSDALPVPAKAALLPPRPSKVMTHTFQSGHGWSVTGAPAAGNQPNDTAAYAIGSQSYKVVTGTTGQNVNIYKWNGTAYDFSNRNIAVLVKVTGSDYLGKFQIQLGSGGSMQNNNTFEVVGTASTDQFMGEGEWTWVTIPWKPTLTGGTGANRAAVTDFQITVRDSNVGTPVTVNVQAIAAVPIPAAWTTGCVSFDLDDGFASHYTIARPILSKYGFAANAYPVTEAIDTTGTYMTTAQLQELQNTSGWTIGAHSDTWAHHNMALSAQTQSELEDFVRANRKWLSDRGLTGFDFFAYPGGISQGANLTVARKFYVTARTVSQRIRETLPASDPHLLRIILMTSTTTTAGIQAEVDAAYTGNYHLILVAHDIVASGATSGTILTATFQTIVDYVATKGIPVKTMQQVLATR